MSQANKGAARLLCSVAVLLSAASGAHGQTDPEPAAPPRAKAPPLALAMEAAQTAMAKCQADHYQITALVVDAVGVPVVMMSSDGVKIATQDTAMRKAWTSLTYKVPSGIIRDKVRLQGDKALAETLKANPRIVAPLRGALPIMVGGELIGAVAVAGAPGGYKDEPCAQAGLDRIASRLK